MMLIDPLILQNIDVQSIWEHQANPEIKELQQQLVEIILETAQKHLTPIQLERFNLYYIEGLSDKQIAEIQGVNKSAVQKCRKGNAVWRQGKRKIVGGYINKLRILISDNQEVKDILKEINRIRLNNTD